MCRCLNKRVSHLTAVLQTHGGCKWLKETCFGESGMKDNEPKRGKWRHSLKTVLVAGTRAGVPALFQLISVASLARMGNQSPCPLPRCVVVV